mgnify:CR=1 FL=1
MNFFYNLIVYLSFLFLKVYAFFNKKIKLFVAGRKEIDIKISVIKNTDKIIWFHVASLGEFEQAVPIIEEVKRSLKTHKILLTFFSPSGYEIKKNYILADIICYLPFDTNQDVKQFIELVHPEMVVILKYEFWPNLLNQLKRNGIPTILVSGIFRKDQVFFKPTGKWMRKSLTAFHHFFVQDEFSKGLLESISIKNVSMAGDTRFDRVAKILEQDNSLPFIEEFKNNQYTVVAGSTWEEGEQFLVNYINQSSNEKFIIAPHTIHPKSIQKLKDTIQKQAILYSDKDGKDLSTYDVFILDTIGLLKKVYSYADVAYVGGAFKTGLHNILEPATFGIPIVIGTKYSKFKEAVDLVELKGCISVNNQIAFSRIFNQLKQDESYRKKIGNINSNYIKKNIGATTLIMKYINKQLKV